MDIEMIDWKSGWKTIAQRRRTIRGRMSIWRIRSGSIRGTGIQVNWVNRFNTAKRMKSKDFKRYFYSNEDKKLEARSRLNGETALSVEWLSHGHRYGPDECWNSKTKAKDILRTIGRWIQEKNKHISHSKSFAAFSIHWFEKQFLNFARQQPEKLPCTEHVIQSINSDATVFFVWPNSRSNERRQCFHLNIDHC